MQSELVLAVTPGDPAGIGPEIVVKTIRKGKIPPKALLVIFGAEAPLKKLKLSYNLLKADFSREELKRLAKKTRRRVFLVASPNASNSSSLEGFQSGWSIEAAVKSIQQRSCDAIVTGPISKERLNAGGFPFPGHTEFLSHLCQTREATMMLANSELKITLVTIHVPLSKVSSVISPQKIERAVNHTVDALIHGWGVRAPKIAVCALNPHAGEGGLLGTEEKDFIGPTLNQLRQSWKGRAELLGPLPADTLFAQNALSKPKDRFDAVVCMYHDQGLIPIKLIDFPRTVNITLGLPIVRTSVDHGVAFDIAGKGLADPSSFQAALTLAARLASQRAKTR